MGLVFVILGLILYIVYAAVCGAIVTKAEDANKAVQPLVYLTLLGLLFSSMSLIITPTVFCNNYVLCTIFIFFLNATSAN